MNMMKLNLQSCLLIEKMIRIINLFINRNLQVRFKNIHRGLVNHMYWEIQIQNRIKIVINLNLHFKRMVLNNKI